MAETQTTPAPETPADWNRGQVVPYWLVAIVTVLLVAVVGLGSYMLYQRIDASNRADEVITEVEQWQAGVAADPSDVTARVSLGYALQKEGRYKEAIEAYEAALKLDPENIGALYNRGVCLTELGDKQAAEQYFREVLRVAPRHALAAAALGEYYLETMQYDKIEGAVAAAAASNARLADLHAMLGVAYEKTGRPDEAIAQYETALRVAPDLPLAKEGLARLKGQD